MTRVDFYVLQTDSPTARSQLACRLTEKAWAQNMQIYLHTQDPQQASALDNLMWTFRQGSFIPHQIFEPADKESCPVLIGHEHEPESINQLLINLDHEVPMFFSRFERVIEIVDQDETVRSKGREKYRFYKDRGYELQTHKL